jgi:3-hydroxy acid dehydrogenase/malonic semialdehyde reductase
MSSPKKHFSDMTACITGASSGIGEAIALDLAKDGWNLCLGARRLDRLSKLKERLLSQGASRVEIFQLDVRNEKNVSTFHESVLRTFGKAPYLLINNAGLARGRDKVINANLEHWREMIDTNLTGLMLTSKAFVGSMIANGSGHIVMIGSIAGNDVYEGGSAYCASKFGVRAFTECLRLELCGTNVRMTLVDPGMVETEFSLVRLENESAAKDVYKGMTPLTGADIAQSVMFAVNSPAHVNIAKMVLLPTDQASVSRIHRR